MDRSLDSSFSSDSFASLPEGLPKKKKAKKKKQQQQKKKKRPKTPSWIDCRTFNYGAKAPLTNLKLVSDQIKTAHQFRNALVGVELDRRAKVDADIVKLPGAVRLAKVEALLIKKEAEIAELRAQKKALHIKARTKKIRNAPLERAISALAKEIKELREERKELRAKTFDSKAWKRGEDRRRLWFNAENRRCYKEADLTAIGTGGRIQTESGKTRSGPPPHFKRYDGAGKLSVQLMGGLSVEDALACKDSRLRIKMVRKGIWVRGSRKKKATHPDASHHLDADGYPMRFLGNAWVHIRVASLDKKDQVRKGGHKPVWAVVPVNMHRDLPEDAMLKWVFLLRKKRGTSETWSVQFSVAEDTRTRAPDPSAATQGHVAIDVGWRLIPRSDDERTCGFRSEDHEELVHGHKCPQKAIRAAYWIGSDGQEGELRLPPRLICALYKVYDIQSIRDKSFNAVREELLTWKKAQRTVPGWLKKTLKHAHSWRKPVRLVYLIRDWQERRFKGDAAIFDRIDTWCRVEDKHLYNYEAHLRAQAHAWRNEVYRRFVADLRRQYATVVLEDINMSALAKRKAPEEAHLEEEATRRHRHIAAISVLRTYFGEKMRVVKVDPAGTSYLCNNCGCPSFRGSSAAVHTCSTCGTTWDRDANAARNILERGLLTEKVASA